MSLTAPTYWAQHAWLGDRAEPGTLIETAADGTIAAVRTGVTAPPPGAVTLRGLTLPGLANAHSHAFHRALRGTVQRDRGTFWTWRETMYEVAGRLTPDSYFALARAVYAEMALAGITCVGEFHYLHHQSGGTPYADPNAMGEALIAAAAEAGIRITLLDTAYLHGGLTSDGHRPLEGPQLRFGDGSADAWYERWRALKGGGHARIGAALHSVRAFSEADGYGEFARWTEGVPTHIHLSEQPAENEACLAVHGRTPTRLLADHGFWRPTTSAVHATHLTDEDIALLGAASTTVCMCPTTERDLADGIGPAVRLAEAGCPLSLGSDSHAVIDLLEEARAMELDERLRTQVRGHWSAARLLDAATGDGHASLGWPEAGRLAPGALADFSTVALDTVRTAGPPARLAGETAVFAATGADIRHTVVGGRHVVRDGRHLLVPDVPAALADAIGALHG
ncbi:formimidoylglutamate deiminase [Streptomyces sp. PTM05]|uniref:Formimidoylglutamate deiminase n=1 Tax=Streptantibioticus parmotrematis TaxID=2873249 RepID=A0ABS7QX27_9ACTN|nr:formimidoylglutamate deiminase [Streptantibioticus parmotrematis]MBY8887753.1 formimidoylglutamate deiminase [Streptantibioticus parmotrematis]